MINVFQEENWSYWTKFWRHLKKSVESGFYSRFISRWHGFGGFFEWFYCSCFGLGCLWLSFLNFSYYFSFSCLMKLWLVKFLMRHPRQFTLGFTCYQNIWIQPVQLLAVRFITSWASMPPSDFCWSLSHSSWEMSDSVESSWSSRRWEWSCLIDCPQRTVGTESLCREGGYNRQLVLSFSGAFHSHSWITCALFCLCSTL